MLLLNVRSYHSNLSTFNFENSYIIFSLLYFIDTAILHSRIFIILINATHSNYNWLLNTNSTKLIPNKEQFRV